MSDYQYPNFGRERTPAQQAEEIARKARTGMNLAAGEAKRTWFNFSKPEKIMAAGALAGLLAFFLPWVSAGGESISGFKVGSQSAYAYLLPLTMLVSLALLYFTQGASETNKALATRWQIVIGSFGATIGLIMIFSIRTITGLMGQFMGGLGSFFGVSSFRTGGGIGVYLFAAGTIAIVVGAFKLQTLLMKKEEKHFHADGAGGIIDGGRIKNNFPQENSNWQPRPGRVNRVN